MDRREMLGSVGALALAALAVDAVAADHDHHNHGGKYQGLIGTSGDCVRTGEACLSHCLDLLGKGDKEMAACAKSVNDLLAVCGALQRLATTESPLLPKYARLAGEFCEGCEKECRKHEKKHSQCKDCAEACAACLKECRKIAV